MEYLKLQKDLHTIVKRPSGRIKRVVLFQDELITRKELSRLFCKSAETTAENSVDLLIEHWVASRTAKRIDIPRKDTYKSFGVRYASMCACDKYTGKGVDVTTFRY